MPLLGAHLSIAGGCHKALLLAESFGCQTVQIFTKNANQWQAKPFTDDEVTLFRKEVRRLKLKCVTAHDSYLINLASPDPMLYQKSLEAFIVEVQRAEQLGLSYLVMHPGAHTTDTPEAGLARVATALDTVHDRCPNFRVQVLLETTAGQGTTLGHRFEHLATLLESVKQPRRLGVCLDTCHIFAAGYPLGTREEYEATFAEFDRVVGLKWLRLFHVNDSVKGHGSRVDRHAGLGKGKIGLDAFRWLVQDERFRGHPMILETPKEDGEVKDMDRVNLAILRGYLDPVENSAIPA
jgi:deoxyribonuclease-4